MLHYQRVEPLDWFKGRFTGQPQKIKNQKIHSSMQMFPQIIPIIEWFLCWAFKGVRFRLHGTSQFLIKEGPGP